MEYYYREKYQLAFLKATEVINEIDPMGLIEFCGPEEYDIGVGDILSRLGNCNTADDVSRMVIDVFTHWFDDPGDLEKYKNVGEKLILLKHSLK